MCRRAPVEEGWRWSTHSRMMATSPHFCPTSGVGRGRLRATWSSSAIARSPRSPERVRPGPPPFECRRRRRFSGLRDCRWATGSFYGDYTFTTGYSLARRVLELTPSPTALICGNDQMAADAYLALARHGLRVPQDMTVVGYDDEPLAAMLTPKLTTVELPFYELGRLGTLALLADTPVTGQHLVPTKLLVRDSSAPCPR